MKLQNFDVKFFAEQFQTTHFMRTYKKIAQVK